MVGEEITVLVTKNALTQGILEMRVKRTKTPSMVVIDSFGAKNHLYAGEWWMTKPEAIAAADMKRIRQIHRLEMELARLRALKFE